MNGCKLYNLCHDVLTLTFEGERLCKHNYVDEIYLSELILITMFTIVVVIMVSSWMIILRGIGLLLSKLSFLDKKFVCKKVKK